MKNIKVSNIFAFALLSTVFVFSDSFAKSCGPNCEYTIDDDGNVVVTGTNGGNGVLTGLQSGDSSKVTNLVVSDGIKEITGGFSYSPVTDITISSSVTKIGDYAFSHTSSLSSISILGENVEMGAALYNSHPQNISHNNITYSCGTGCTATLDSNGNAVYSGTGSIQNRAPTGFDSQVTNITIEDGITSIGNGAFSYLTATDITIPASVTKIGDYAFSHTSSLNNITILGENVEMGAAFYNSHPQNISHNNITYSCGTGCTAILDSNGNAVYSGTGSIQNRAPTGFDSQVINVTIEEGIKSIGNGAFSYLTATDITIPASVTKIGDYAFSHTSSLNNMIIKGENVEISNSAFYNSIAGNGKITYTTGGLTEQYILGKFPNANLKRIIGPHKYWTMEELMEVLRDDNTNSVSFTW